MSSSTPPSEYAGDLDTDAAWSLLKDNPAAQLVDVRGARSPLRGMAELSADDAQSRLRRTGRGSIAAVRRRCRNAGAVPLPLGRPLARSGHRNDAGGLPPCLQRRRRLRRRYGSGAASRQPQRLEGKRPAVETKLMGENMTKVIGGETTRRS